MWYAVFIRASGELLSIGTEEPSGLPSDKEYIGVVVDEQPNSANWDPENMIFTEAGQLEVDPTSIVDEMEQTDSAETDVTEDGDTIASNVDDNSDGE